MGSNETVLERLERRLDTIEYKLKSIEVEVESNRQATRDLGAYILFGALIFASLTLIAVSYIADLPSDAMLKSSYDSGFTAGYRQGVKDALGDPENVLAKLLCQGEYNATVTIDGREFSLVCQEQG